MRQQIDCAVLILAAHQSWLSEILKELEPALNRVKIHFLEWEAGHDLDLNFSLDQASPVRLPFETLAQASIGLRRYDVVLLPVSMETLAWTRQALAAIPRGPFIPLIGILKEIRSAAIQDLLEMGMSDFVRLPVCTNEFRARLLHAVTSVPRPGSLREPSLNYGQKIAIARGVLPIMGEATLSEWLKMTRVIKPSLSRLPKGHAKNVLEGRLPQASWASQVEDASVDEVPAEDAEDIENSEVDELAVYSPRIDQRRHLRTVKAKLIEEFERAYLKEALDRNRGNIANAARYSGKHRRAFWALMRKYGIEAVDFRS